MMGKFSYSSDDGTIKRWWDSRRGCTIDIEYDRN